MSHHRSGEEFSPDDLARLYQELSHTVREIHWRELLPVRLTMPQLKVLHVLSRRGKVSPGELAEILGVSPPTATDIVDRMATLGLVRKERSSEDRRVVYVSATAAGEETLQRVLQERWSLLRELFARMSPSERNALGRGLEALRDAVRRFREEEGAGQHA